MSKIVCITDIDVVGSGYKYVMTPLLDGLAALGHEIKVAGLNYTGLEHSYKFSIIPAKDMQDCVAIANNLMYLWQPDFILVGMDIPIQLQIFEMLKGFQKPYIAITPLENGPLTMSWAAGLMGMSYVFFISELGKQEALKAGLTKVDHLVVGVDTESWKPPTPDERKQIREGLGIREDEFVVLSVADNQERKNLAAGLEIIAGLKKELGEKPVRYILVTREKNPFGLNIRDYSTVLGVNKELNIYERGMPRDRLWGLYAAADSFLNTSKAEGLCVLPDTRVWTETGLKSIQDVHKDDYVIADDGELHRVTETFVRDLDESINIIDMGFGLESILVTQNHPILSVRNQGRKFAFGKNTRKLSSLFYNQASILNKGDYVFYPRPKESSESSIYIDDYVDGVIVDDNGLVQSIGRNQFGAEFIHPASRNSTLNNEVKIDKDFCSLLGWFVAEGCDTKEGLSFSLHWNEVSYREHIRRILKDKFNLDLHDNFRDRHRYDGRVYGKVVGNLFSSMCGKDATTKHLPHWALFLDDEKSWALIESLFSGDGTYSSYDASLRYSTASKDLSRQIQFLLFRMGVVSSVRDSKNRLEYVVTIHRPEIYKVPFLHDYIPAAKKYQSQFIEMDDGWLIPIRSNTVSRYKGKVYNLEVDSRHSYLLAGGIVHNCLPVLDTMAAGIPVVATDTGALHELLQSSRGYLIPPKFSFIDVFGNSKRDMIDVSAAVNVLYPLAQNPSVYDSREVIINALEYIKSRTWDIPVQQVQAVIERINNEQKAQQ